MLPNPIAWLEALGGRLEHRFPRIAASDVTDEQTHINHALLTVLLFGTLGVLATLVFTVGVLIGHTHSVSGLDQLPVLSIATFGLKRGLATGLVFYALREVLQRIAARRMSWDGWLDVLFPLAFVLPTLLGGHVWVLYGLSVVLAAFYYGLRPLPRTFTR